MKSKIIIILLSLVVIACNSSKKTTEDNLKSNQSFFKENSRDWSVNIHLEQLGKKYNVNRIFHDSGKYD